jgi:hypothetical protein
MDYDDAFVAYLNDVEIARAGISGTHPAFNQTGNDHEATVYAGGAPESFVINSSMLKTCLLPGENVLSIQVHNSTTTSSDMSSNANLFFGIKNTSSYFRPIPYWFVPPVDFTSSNLPIVIINTDGGTTIRDDPRVKADMKIIYRGENQRNYLTDETNASYLNYNGRIDIEIRGSSSQDAPKKQYGFSTKLADGITNNNIKLLGLPEDNDWILNGLVFEPSLMRNFLCYNLSRLIGEYASRTVYCELVLNGQYMGLYLLLEKVKQGDDRVNVAKIDATDNSYPDITGGYITKADKTTGGDPVAWTMTSSLGSEVAFIHSLPDPDVVTAKQNTYIKSEFEKLRNSAASGNISLVDGYPSVIDIPSFIDYMIITELSANADGYQYSTYYHKDKNGKLRAGPLWDYDLTFGYDLFFWGYDRSKTNTWQFSNGDNEGPAFWKQLFNNPTFKCLLSKRWHELIKPGRPLNISSINQLIDQTDLKISEAVLRENIKWGTSPNHANEISKIKTFIQDRTQWITNNIGTECNLTPVIPPLVITKIMYCPDSSLVFPESKDQEFIEILNAGNETVNLAGVYFSGTGFVYQFSPTAFVGPHAKIILASKSSVFMAKYNIPVHGQFTRNLSNTGEALVLVDGFGNVIDSVRYSNLPPWPFATANGSYLDLTDPMSDNSKAVSWTAVNTQIVSVEDPLDAVSVKLYPSPVKEYLTLETPWSKYVLQLYDFQGRLMKTVNIDSDYFNLDMKQLTRGIYLVRMITPYGNLTRKIIKE